MKAKELRIGNYVLLNTGFTLPFPHVIMAKDIQDISIGMNEEWSVEPIPLTEEILSKAKLNYAKELKIGRVGIIVAYDEDNKDYHLLYSSDVGGLYVNIKIVEYLHDLQNTIYSLTNHELEITL